VRVWLRRPNKVPNVAARDSFAKHIVAAVAENELKLMSDRRKAVCAILKARGVNIAQQLNQSRIHRPEDLDAARAARLKLDTARAIAMAPLLAELRDAGKTIHGVAAELTRLEVETPHQGLKWHSPTNASFSAGGGASPN
jgi:hypothetical protein